MITALIFIAVLSVLILVHELGHFWAAKKSGCAVEEFGIGFPPRVFSFKRGETLYSINLLPFGGFVKIKGENGEDQPDEKSFVSRSFSWKMLIISAGVLMNVALAYVLITANLIVGVGSIVDGTEDLGRWARLDNRHISIIEILPESPAALAGFQVGDDVISVNNVPAQGVDQTIASIADGVAPLHIQIERNGQAQEIEVSPAHIVELNRSAIGVGMSETADLSYPWYVAWWYGLERTGTLLVFIVQSFGQLLATLAKTGTVAADVAGPIGIAVITGEVAKLGFTHLVQFAALLSLNLAVINILPFPALDGGRLALIVMERLRGKKLRVQVEQWIQVAGFVFLIVLMIAVTAHDIGKYGGSIWHSITNLFS